MSNGFNTLSTNRVASGAATFSTGSVGVFPTFAPHSGAGVNYNKRDAGNRVEGFVGDGDYIVLPLDTGSIDYFNSSDVSQSGFPIAPTDIDAASDKWVAWQMTAAGLIYAVAVDTTTSPHTFYTATINSAGTINNIGNDQASVNFTYLTTYWIGGAAGAPGTTMYRPSDDAGNLFVLSSGDTGLIEVMEIDVSNGAIVSDPAFLYESFFGAFNLNYKTPKGNYIGQFSFDSGTGLMQMSVFGNSGAAIVNLDASTGLSTSLLECAPIMWKGYITLATGNSSAIIVGASRNLTKAGFDSSLDQLAKNVGAST